MELITSLKENNVPGFEVTVSYTRQYHTNLAAHLLGYTGLMNAEEYTTYKTQGYPMSATVGKDGAELAFEKYLHGTDGTAIVTKNAAGTVTGTTYTKEPEPGNQVSLTIDLDLQSAAEQSLTKGIENMKSKSTENSDAVGGGALVAVDVATGQPLAIANYPTFDLQTLFQSEENYKAVSEADNQPLFNRALLGQYSPGSTFKPCTAIAGLTEGVITTGTTIQCTGTFRKYEDTGYAPKCWIASSGTTHGNDNVTEAIRDSCNIFFYTVGDSLPIDTLARYAAAFGLGRAHRHRAAGEHRPDGHGGREEEAREHELVCRRLAAGGHRPVVQPVHAAAAFGILRHDRKRRHAPQRVHPEIRAQLRRQQSSSMKTRPRCSAPSRPETTTGPPCKRVCTSSPTTQPAALTRPSAATA